MKYEGQQDLKRVICILIREFEGIDAETDNEAISHAEHIHALYLYENIAKEILSPYVKYNSPKGD